MFVFFVVYWLWWQSRHAYRPRLPQPLKSSRYQQITYNMTLADFSNSLFGYCDRKCTQIIRQISEDVGLWMASNPINGNSGKSFMTLEIAGALLFDYLEILGKCWNQSQTTVHYIHLAAVSKAYLIVSNSLTLESWTVRSLRVKLDSLTNFGSFSTF